MKLALKVGTWPWLLRHEMRLQLRAVGVKRLWMVGLFGGLIWLALHATAWLLLVGLDSVSLPPKVIIIFGALTWLIITLMFSQAIMLSVTALFDRGDFDLLLASPLNPRTVFTVRGMGIAVGCVVLYFLLVTLGARRARVVAQLFGAVVGAAMFMLSQVQNMLGRQTRDQIAVLMKDAAEPGGVLAPDSALWFPFRAFTGEPIALLSVVILGVGGFFLVVKVAYTRFLSGTQESVTGSANKKNSSSSQAKRFQKSRGGFVGTVLMKEWRLIWRDPQLIAQTLLQALYLLPVVFIAFRNTDALNFVVPGAVLLAATLAGSIAWITVSAEEAPELIGTAPVNLTRIRWLKVLAALIPVWIFVSPLLFFLLTKNLLWTAVFLFCLAGSTVSAGMIQVWYPRMGDRKNMKKRAQGSMLINMVEGFCAFGWSGAAYALMLIPSPWAWLALVGIAFAALGPTGAWVLGKSRREQGALV